jgi:4,4'-diaponeurosporenoate glycosyltransferase
MLSGLRLFLLPLQWLLGFFLLWRIPAFAQCAETDDHDREDQGASVSVIVPARNEEGQIPQLLESLARQTVKPREVIVVDDHSTDGTAAIAGRMGTTTLLASQPLPGGWTGKTWACWQGAQHASGTILLFLDADVRLEPDALACLLRSLQEQGGLLSVQPYHETQQRYEELSAFFNILLMAGMNAFTPLGPSLAPSGAFGPCLMVGRSDYIALGGHQHPMVRGEVLESIPLARLFQRHGFPVHLHCGRGAVSFRMYPGGYGQLVEGWSKGFGTGALATKPLFLLAIIAWISGCFAAVCLLLAALARPSELALAAYALLYGLFALQIWWMLRRVGSYRFLTTLLYPLPLTFFLVIMIRSLVQIRLRGRVPWRGRTVPAPRKGDWR